MVNFNFLAEEAVTSNLDKFINYFRAYTNDFSAVGIIALIVDLLLVLALIIFIAKVLRIKFKAKKLFLFIIIIMAIYGVTYFCNLNITYGILKAIAFWSIGVLVIIYASEIKHAIENGLHTNQSGSVYNSEEEKMKVIDEIVKSAVYLSERKIGAIVTIERNDSLDKYIEGSVYINGELSKELLTSLFFVGSDTHDGAVIIRKNCIMCAAAYYKQTTKYDIPKEYGSRHRAAIGISEECDAVTVVVSEETGKISVTADSNIKRDFDAESLKDYLAQKLISK